MKVGAALAFAGTSGRLADLDTRAAAGLPTPKNPAKRLRRDADAIADLQERLYAESTVGGQRRVLLVLQGIDTAGKGGVTEHVVGACGPIGVEYTAFKKPTEEEAAHDFLWRIRKRLPPAGVVGIFDRSHYEDVLVPRVHDLLDDDTINGRYRTINDFEKELAAAGTTLVKCFLHISADTQRRRLLSRLDRPDKHWKFNEADLDERARWPRYQDAFEEMLRRSDSAYAPWYVIPSDSKKYRNWAVGALLREVLETMGPRYPEVPLDVDRLRHRLEPPGGTGGTGDTGSVQPAG